MDEFVTIKQLASEIGVHPLTIRRYIKKGALRAVRVGRTVRINQSEAEAFIQTYDTAHLGMQGKEPGAKVFTKDDPLFQLVRSERGVWKTMVSHIFAALKRLRKA